ncbi:MAG: DNA primase DnaG [Promethearchaeota archaeon]
MKNGKNIEFNSSDQFSTTKYIIKINYTIKGHVDVMDIIGALFGQTEGLLNDLELRELQKTGRIGRIQVNNNKENGNSVGEILIPSSLDRVETAILAATIESVDRVGPCVAKMQLAEIIDIREDKRKKIMDRAKELLQKWDLNTPEAEEISENILSQIRTGELIEYGPEKLPAGEDIDKSNQIIIVEGVADVKALMKAGFRNAIATNGTSIPKTIIELSKKKSCIAFVDGDRGGEMILNELLQVADIDYIAIAPKGVMVEELTRKEIIKHLQNKKTLQEYLSSKVAQNNQTQTQIQIQTQTQTQTQTPIQNLNQKENINTQSKEKQFKNVNLRYKSTKKQIIKKSHSTKKNFKPSKMKIFKSADRHTPHYKQHPQKQKLKINDNIVKEFVKSLIASNEAIGLDGNKEIIFKVGNTQIINALESSNNVNILILDGVVSQRLIDKAAEKNVKTIIAVNKSKKLKIPQNKKIAIYLFSEFV